MHEGKWVQKQVQAIKGSLWQEWFENESSGIWLWLSFQMVKSRYRRSCKDGQSRHSSGGSSRFPKSILQFRNFLCLWLQICKSQVRRGSCVGYSFTKKCLHRLGNAGRKLSVQEDRWGIWSFWGSLLKGFWGWIFAQLILEKAGHRLDRKVRKQLTLSGD